MCSRLLGSGRPESYQNKLKHIHTPDSFWGVFQAQTGHMAPFYLILSHWPPHTSLQQPIKTTQRSLQGTVSKLGSTHANSAATSSPRQWQQQHTSSVIKQGNGDRRRGGEDTKMPLILGCRRWQHFLWQLHLIGHHRSPYVSWHVLYSSLPHIFVILDMTGEPRDGRGWKGWMEGFHDDLLESAFNKGVHGHSAYRPSAGLRKVVSKFFDRWTDSF